MLNRILNWVERYVFAGLPLILGLVFAWKMNILESKASNAQLVKEIISTSLQTSITVLSIIIGFVATSWSILLTRNPQSPLEKSDFFKKKKCYFKHAISASMVALIFSMYTAGTYMLTEDANTTLFSVSVTLTLLAVSLSLKAKFVLFFLDKD